MQTEINKHPKFNALHQKMIDTISFALGSDITVFYNTNIDALFSEIEAIVLNEFKITKTQLYNTGRNNYYVNARQVLVYLVIKYSPLKNATIAKFIGKDRATVSYSFNKVNDLLSINDPITIKINNCITKIIENNA